MKRPAVALALAVMAWAPAHAQPQAARPAIDYGNMDNWLCLPGRADACSVDESATVVSTGGRLTLQEFSPAKDPRVDCFYVYPTLSNDPGQFSDMIANAEERRIIAQQLARFGAACKTYAPLYRQFTISALGPVIADSKRPIDIALSREPPYADVLAAWRHYLTNYNLGRGVVLIGHSQGSMHLIRLLAEEIEGRPVQAQLVSAIILGANVQVPPGQTMGGSFRSIPLCKSDSQTGCVITYSSFRDTNPPAPGALFGQGYNGMAAGCTNPADLRKGTGQPKSYFLAPGTEWTNDRMKPVGTPFATTPGLVTTTCVTGPAGTYLQVHVNADPKDPRTDDIPGDLMSAGKPNPQWGLHLVDMNLSIGNLVDIVAKQARAWRPAP